MKKKILWILVIAASIALIGYAAWQIVTTLLERYASKQEYEQVRESYVSSISSPSSSDEDDDDYYPDLEIDIEGLLATNEDFVAWIYYEDGEMSYPVVQEDEVNEYLYKTFEGSENSSGCLFIPYDASDDFSDLNTFIYGHNMANGTMMGSLKYIYQSPTEKYLDPYFYIYTKDGRAIRYRVIAAYVVESTSEMFSVPLGSESYKEYLDKIMSLGSLSSYISFTEEEESAMDACSPIVTLSTCYGASGTSKRLLIHGVQIEERTLSTTTSASANSSSGSLN